MSQHSGGGQPAFQTMNVSTYTSHDLYRLSSENVSSPYDDRLDKVDPEGTAPLPGPAGRNR